MGFFLGLLHLDVLKSVQQGLHVMIEELLLGLGLGLLSNLDLIGVCLESWSEQQHFPSYLLQSLTHW